MQDIPDRVLTFLRDSIDSVEQLEALLLLRNNPEKLWSADELSRALSSHPDAAAARLLEFHHAHLVACYAGEKPQYRYQPQSEVLDRTISELNEVYARYRVRLIHLIYSKPIDKIRTFADAFKFRKEDE